MDNHLFSVEPSRGQLQPGECKRVTLQYCHIMAGTDRLPVLLKIADGREILVGDLLNFVGFFCIIKKDCLIVYGLNWLVGCMIGEWHSKWCLYTSNFLFDGTYILHVDTWIIAIHAFSWLKCFVFWLNFTTVYPKDSVDKSALVNSLAPGKFQWNFRHVISRQILVIVGWGISCEIAIIWMALDFTDYQSTLVQVMAWCHQATSHYLSQCWPRSLSLYSVTRPQ